MPLVGSHPPVEVGELVTELADGTCRELLQVTHGKRVCLRDSLNLACEGQVIANKNLSAGDQTRRQALVVAVAQPNDPAEVAVIAVGQVDLNDSEVTLPVMSQAWVSPRSWKPAACSWFSTSVTSERWGSGYHVLLPCGVADLEEILPIDNLCAAVEQQSLGADFRIQLGWVLNDLEGASRAVDAAFACGFGI